MAQVDGAVGVGGAIVEHILLRAPARLTNLLIQPGFKPVEQAYRLCTGQAGLHREIGSGQSQRLFKLWHRGAATWLGVGHRLQDSFLGIVSGRLLRGQCRSRETRLYRPVTWPFFEASTGN